ncbi:MAG: phosphoglucosamine mutase [Flavobacteriales bacterium]
MTLIKSISGIRGTMGGKEGEESTPIDAVKFTASFCQMMQTQHAKRDIRVVVGRDARISGEMISALVCNTLVAMGARVVNLGLSTTPSVEVAVTRLQADAGIILTASHNPKQWNALKLLNHIGEFISAEEGENVLRIAESGDVVFADIDQLGTYEEADFLHEHIASVCALPLVNADAIRSAQLRVAVDAVNSTGGIYIPELLRALGVEHIECIHCHPDGHFPHNPEPLPEHLTDISNLVVEKQCDLGIVVDPDVDRLAFVCEDGSVFGEEYTLVAVADYVLKHKPGNTVSNLSSTRALRDVTIQHGGAYTAAAVGEVNVVKAMKSTQAVIGGEGNGGIIYPEAHYGRDALAGLALFLSHFAEMKMTMTALRKSYPSYEISKNKIELNPKLDVDALLKEIIAMFPEAEVNLLDGVKFDFADGWVHLRKSNTEPIIRIIAEHQTRELATALAQQVMDVARDISAKQLETIS